MDYSILYGLLAGFLASQVSRLVYSLYTSTQRNESEISALRKTVERNEADISSLTVSINTNLAISESKIKSVLDAHEEKMRQIEKMTETNVSKAIALSLSSRSGQNGGVYRTYLGLSDDNFPMVQTLLDEVNEETVEKFNKLLEDVSTRKMTSENKKEKRGEEETRGWPGVAGEKTDVLQEYNEEEPTITKRVWPAGGEFRDVGQEKHLLDTQALYVAQA